LTAPIISLIPSNVLLLSIKAGALGYTFNPLVVPEMLFEKATFFLDDSW
jgi:hypothetical protein